MATHLTSQSQVRETVSRIVRDNPEIAPDLVDLLVAVIDPNGDPLRRGLGEVALKDLYVLTPEFEEAFRLFLAA